MNVKWIYLQRNLTRNPLRTALTCAAVALPIVIYVLSTAVIDGVDRFLSNSVKQLRLVVQHKASIVNPLPISYRKKIESLDPAHKRITSVCGMKWIGGAVENVHTPLSTLAVQHDTLLDTFPEYDLTPAQKAAWLRDRQAIIVGRATAGTFGWKEGDRITIRPSLPPYTPMEFHVISTAEHATDRITNWCRLDYFDEELKKLDMPEGLVSFFFVKCVTRADLDHFQRGIDELFARTPDETRTQDEKAFMSEYIKQQFDLPRNLAILSAVTVFVAVMAATNTMSMSFRDRLNEFATLKSLGFGRAFGMFLIQAESLTVCLTGGILGAAAPYILFTHTPVRDFVVPVIQHLEIPVPTCFRALGIAALIGVLAGLWPAWLAARLHVVNALRSLE